VDQNQLRRAVVNGLKSAGQPDPAALAASPRSTMLGPVRELPGGAAAVMFEAFPHPNASFYAGLAGGRVYYLTGTPHAFGDMMRATGLQITEEQTAAEIARAYVETTRTMDTFTGILNSADDIGWDTRPEHEPDPGMLAWLRESVRPASVMAVGPGRYEVSLFVLHGTAVERRVLNVNTDGTVIERTEQVVSDLPVPISF
jgi:hypothetical protein